MSPELLISDCSAAGVSVHLVGDTLKLRGSAEAVKAISERVRTNKAALLAYLSASPAVDLVAEFMEVDGMTREEAQAMAAISVQPRPSGEWLAMIAELDCLIERYCDGHRLTREARMHIMATRTKQSLASIPAALAWFRRELVASG